MVASPLAPDDAISPTKVAVIGAGYVGTPTALLLSKFGHPVVLAERDHVRRTALEQGRSAMVEAGIEELLVEQLATGRLHVVEDAAIAVRDAVVIFLCVATPMGTDGHADLTALDSVIHQIRDSLVAGAIVVNKSTVPVGTAERVATLLDRDDISVVSNPEFLREGTAVTDVFRPDRTVVGSSNREAAEKVAELFVPTGAPAVITDARTAEMIKYAANSFLAVKLSFINSFAQLCDQFDADIEALADGLGRDPRIGRSFLKAGPGWGGPCLPKDTTALVAMARESGVALPLIEAAIDANALQRDYVAHGIMTLLGTTTSPTVAVLGLSFKALTDDRRDSPAIDVITRLLACGVHVVGFDPIAPPDSSSDIPEGVHVAASALDAARNADAIVVLTEWPEFAELDLVKLAGVMRQHNLYDARNIIDLTAARNAGFHVASLGRR